MESCSNANGSKFGKAEVFSPAGLVAYAEGAVVSRTVVESGESIIMPANIPHALSAVTAFKMMLVMIKA